MPRIPDRMRERFRAPLGVLVADAHVGPDMLDMIPDRTRIITVGDATTERITGFGILPVLQIVDGYERRARRDMPAAPDGVAVLRCQNPAGGVLPDCIDLIRGCLGSGRPSRIEVDGEEDLLAVPACMYAPDGASVLYGQPNEGMVVVRAGPESRDRARAMMELMQGG